MNMNRSRLKRKLLYSFFVYSRESTIFLGVYDVQKLCEDCHTESFSE